MNQLVVNPFCTSRIRPGALPFQFAPGCSAAALVDRLAELGSRAQIVGPHGSGKSTLIMALIDELASRGVHAPVLVQRDRQRSLDWGKLAELAAATRSSAAGRPAAQPSGGAPATVRRSPQAFVVVDGYEQLGRLSRWRLDWFCRRQAAGLVVTTHRTLPWATLATLRPTADLLVQLVQRLVEPGDTTINPGEAAAAFDHCQGNLREALFSLYDLYEHRRRAERGSVR